MRDSRLPEGADDVHKIIIEIAYVDAYQESFVRGMGTVFVPMTDKGLVKVTDYDGK